MRRTSRPVALRVVALRVVALCALALSAGCGGERPEAPAPAAPGELGAVLGRIAGAAAGSQVWTAPSPDWPADLAVAPDAPVEAREWLSVLRDERGGVWGLRQRLVRARLPDGASAGPPASGGRSAWRFDAVVRVDATLEAPDGTRTRWSATEREAVGLAGAASTGGTGLMLLDHALASAAPLPDAGCRILWRLTVPRAARLSGRQGECPVEARVAGSLAATIGPFAVDGTLGADAAPVSGIAWQRLERGALPTPGGGAVSFDRAVLALEGIGGVELLRSRRTSGRGTPRTTVSALDARARGAGIVDALAVEWTLPTGDAEAGESAEIESRAAGRLRVPALGIDVALRALSPVTATHDGLERAFRGAVIAAGSHRGAGFVEVRPVGADALPDIDEGADA